MKQRLVASAARLPVRGANGAELTLYEYRRYLPRHIIGGLRYVRKGRRMELCSGEAAEYVDENTFLIVPTGERLSRIK